MTAAPILPPAGEPLTPDDVTSTRNRALSLADKGYHVFPVRVVVDPATGANTKTYVTGRKDSPVGAKWNATRDPELVRSWWSAGSRFADCMIGIATEPSGVVLIDLDTHAQEDGTRQDGMGEWAKLHPQPYPIPAAVGRSSSGGRHLPFAADPKRPVRTTAGEIAPAVDSRGIGGMFICWSPWLPKVSELPTVPDVVPDSVPWIAPKDREVREYPSAAVAPSGDAQERVCYHRDVIAAAKDGYGVPTASRQAFLAGQHVGAGQVEGRWAADVLLSALAGWTWRRPEDEAKVRAQILKGLADGARQPRPWLTETPLATVSQLSPPPTSSSTSPSAVAAPAATPSQRPQVPRQAPGPLRAEVSPVPSPAGASAPPLGGPDADERDEGLPESVGRRVRLTPAASIVPRRVRWLWDGRWPLGALTLVAGQPGLGKSTIVYDRVARITRGELPGEVLGTPRGALICATEDSWEYTIVPRLMAAGADLDRVYRVDALEEDLETGLILPDDLAAIGAIAQDVEAVVLVLDPLTSRLKIGLDSHKDSETRRALEPLAAFSDRYRLTSVGLMHLNKGGGSDPLTALNGSTAFGGVARSVSFAMYDPDDEERRRKLFGTPKNNLGDSNLPTLGFITVGVDVPIPGEDQPANVGRIEWLDEVEGSIGDAMERAQQDPETRTAVGEAAAWLKDYLNRSGGGADSMAIRDAGRGEGHNARTLQRALKRIGGRAESVKDAFPRRTVWTIPTKGAKPLQIESAEPPSSACADQSRQPVPSTNLVLSVLTGTTNGDSCASGDGGGGRRDLSRQQSAHADDGGSAARQVVAEGMADTPPPWLVEPVGAPAATLTAGSPGTPSQPCPCGRPEQHHSRGSWRTCPAGHRWHAFGAHALDRCPWCPADSSDDPGGGDAA